MGGVTTAGQSARGAVEPPGGTGAESPRLLRAQDGRLVSGVCRGLANHLGVGVVWVRLVFVVLAFANGAGVIMYGGFWLVVPLEHRAAAGSDEDAPEVARTRDRDLLLLLGVGAVAIGAASLAARRGIGSTLLVPLLVAAVGLAVLWRQADDAERLRWRTHASRAAAVGGRPGWLRLAIGAALVGVGLIWTIAATGDLGQVADGLAAGLILLVGVALVAGPYLLRLARDLNDERRERVRSQERAEIAAHVHDSVLQTLTLIQRNADDPQAVSRLARAEERALRTWLYRPEKWDGSSFSAALEHLAGEVEDSYPVTIEVVTVGDVGVGSSVMAVLQATREALVNAAKHAVGHGPVSVYAEAAEGSLEVFVRDRGDGFDVEAVAEDRLGVRESIVGRMARHGGQAEIVSTPQGTEVRIRLPLTGEGSSA